MVAIKIIKEVINVSFGFFEAVFAIIFSTNFNIFLDIEISEFFKTQSSIIIGGEF